MHKLLAIPDHNVGVVGTNEWRYVPNLGKIPTKAIDPIKKFSLRCLSLKDLIGFRDVCRLARVLADNELRSRLLKMQEDGSFISPAWWIKNFGPGCLGDQETRLPDNVLAEYQDMKEKTGQVVRIVYVPQYLIIDGKPVDLSVPVLADTMGSKAAFDGAKYSDYSKEQILDQQQLKVPFTTNVHLAHYVITTPEPLRNSLNRNLQEQEELLTGINKNYSLPTTREAVISFFSNPEATLQKWTRTKDRSYLGYRVYVGGVDADGLFVSTRWDAGADAEVGACVVLRAFCHSARELADDQLRLRPGKASLSPDSLIANVIELLKMQEDGSFIGPAWWIKNFGPGCLGDQETRLPGNALAEYQDMKEKTGQVLRMYKTGQVPRIVYVPQYLIIDGKRVDLSVPVLADTMGSKAAFDGAKYISRTKKWLTQQKQRARFTTYVPPAHYVINTPESLKIFLNRTFHQQEKILTGINENYRFPTAREAIISFFSNPEATLQKGTRTTDCLSDDGDRVWIGFYDAGLDVTHDWDKFAYDYLGACIVRELRLEN